jgi:hypothetical protein
MVAGPICHPGRGVGAKTPDATAIGATNPNPASRAQVRPYLPAASPWFDWYEDLGWMIVYMAGVVSGSILTGFVAWLIP